MQTNFLQNINGLESLPSFSLNQAFMMACQRGDVAMIRHMVTHHAINKKFDPNLHESMALLNACEAGHMPIVKYLTSSKEMVDNNLPLSNVHDNEEMPLRIALLHDHVDIVKFLLCSPELATVGQTPADINHPRISEVLKELCKNNRWLMMEYLIVDYGMQESETTSALIEAHPQVQAMFEKRYLNETLHEALPLKGGAKRAKI